MRLDGYKNAIDRSRVLTVLELSATIAKHNFQQILFQSFDMMTHDTQLVEMRAGSHIGI